MRANSLSKDLTRKIKEIQRSRLQLKATSPNPRVFWSSIHSCLGKHAEKEKLRINKDGYTITEPRELANAFATFLESKALTLSRTTEPEDPPESQDPCNNALFLITDEMVLSALKCLKKKKSYGIDGVPMRSDYCYLQIHQCALFKIDETRLTPNTIKMEGCTCNSITQKGLQICNGKFSTNIKLMQHG